MRRPTVSLVTLVIFVVIVAACSSAPKVPRGCCTRPPQPQQLCAGEWATVVWCFGRNDGLLEVHA